MIHGHLPSNGASIYPLPHYDSERKYQEYACVFSNKSSRSLISIWRAGSANSYRRTEIIEVLLLLPHVSTSNCLATCIEAVTYDIEDVTAYIEAATSHTATVTAHMTPGTIKPLSNLPRPPLKNGEAIFETGFGNR